MGDVKGLPQAASGEPVTLDAVVVGDHRITVTEMEALRVTRVSVTAVQATPTTSTDDGAPDAATP